ncbi:rhodanese-like domain-containing protein [Pedobacter sp. ASV1-7]|uniref:rhodanese-like domain-containing protein n=1 Tax=Pedobacter sp. ASV1-7 TaxID=3145237 RepID=UPI0032E8A089
MKYLLILITYISFNFLSAATGHMPNQAKAQSATSFKAKMDSVKNKTILDVRMPREYSVGHIKGAINYNVYEKDFKEKVSTLDKKRPVFVYCKAGGRSTMAVKQLKELGFTDIHELQGGMLAWEAEKLEVVREKPLKE